MKICHECPVDLLEESKVFNDYEYSLLHLMKIPEYKEFYKKTERMHILDNSAFEYQFIGEKFDISYYMSIIEELEPTHVIVPDVIANTDLTIQEFDKFPRGNYQRIGVVQGKNLEELDRCFDYMNVHADVIAIVFHSPAYMKPGMHKDLANANGRYNYVKSIVERCKKPLHLLGCSLPQEFTWYDHNVRKSIMSIDTANPIQFGILGESYPDDFNIINKPNCVLSEDIVGGCTQNKKVIFDNIKKFRTSLNKENNEVI